MPKSPGQSATTPPRYTGLGLAAGVGFSFAHPLDWTRAADDGAANAAVFSPVPDDPYTLFAVEAVDIPEALDADDAEVLRSELVDAVTALPGAVVLHHEALSAGLFRGADVRYDVDADGGRRRRWVRILVEKTRQVTVTAQGSSPAAFAHWEPQFFTTMATVRVHHGATPPSHDELRA